MSLQVWLPLNGDLENKGLASLTSSGTPVYKTTGKLSDKSFDLNTRVNFTCSALANKTIFSIAFWAKVNDDSNLSTNWVDVIGFTDISSSGTSGQLRWETCYASGSTARGISGHDNATYAITPYSAISGTAPVTVKNVWEHRAFTVSSTQCAEYVNGELRATYGVNGGHLSGAFWIGQAGVVNGELQDVRIYDHCLSEKEIKQLSQGLMLHLPLNNNGLGNENIITGTGLSTFSTSNASTIKRANKIMGSGSGGNGTFSITLDDTCPVGIYSWNVLNNTSGNRDFQQGDQPYVTGTKYTMSWYAKGNGTCLARVWDSTTGTQLLSKTNTLTSSWTYYTWTFTATETMETDSCTFHLGVTGAASINICGMKLEIGSIATPWSLSPLDEDYPDYGPGIPQNLLSGTPKSTTPTTYLFTQLNLLENLQTGKTYTLQLWDVNVSHSAKTTDQIGVWVYWGGGSISLLSWYGSTYFTDGHADYLSKTFTVIESHARGNGSANKYLNLYNSVPSASGTLSASVGKWKLEESSTASDYTPAITDAAYKEEGYNNRAIFDQSGYCRNCANNNKTIYSSDSPKYNVSMFFDGTNRISTSALPAETKTISVWVKTTKNKSTAQCICGDSASALCLFFYSGGLVTYFKGSAGGTGSRVTFGSEYKENDWNHLVVVKTGDTTRDVYCNGVLLTPAANNYYSPATGLWIGQRNATGALPFYGYLSDFRAYATALSEKDVKSLYNNNAYIDSNGKIYGEIR